MDLYKLYIKQKVLTYIKTDIKPLIEQFINEQADEIYFSFNDDKDNIKILLSSEIDNKVKANIKKYIERSIDTSVVKVTKEGFDVHIKREFSQLDFITLVSELKSKLKKNMKRLKSNEYILY